MNRLTRPNGHLPALLALLALVAAVAPAMGCRSVMTMAAYLIKGTDVEPEYDGLKGKKVAVVVRPSDQVTFSNNHSAASDLARQISTLLRANVSKIQVIDQQKVSKWTDENGLVEFADVGKAVKAEMVVGIDLVDFSVLQGQTLYRGNAVVAINVYDCKNDNKVVFEKQLPQALYPPNSSIPTSERTEAQFRREYIKVLADQIARHFYPHDPHADLAQDASTLE